MFVLQESLCSTPGTDSVPGSGLRAGDTRANKTDLIPDHVGLRTDGQVKTNETNKSAVDLRVMRRTTLDGGEVPILDRAAWEDLVKRKHLLRQRCEGAT